MKLPIKASLVVSGLPVPWITVLVNKSGPGAAVGTNNFGDTPNAPVAVTCWFAWDAAAEEDEEDAAGLLEDEVEPQPATAAAAASNGIIRSADARRMATFLGPRPGG